MWYARVVMRFIQWRIDKHQEALTEWNYWAKVFREMGY